MSVFLGIDIGTGSSKAVLVTADGQIIDRETVAHKIQRPHPGWAEADAQTQWWAEVCQLSKAIAQRQNLTALDGLCVSGMGPCLVLTDDETTPLRPAILYGIDTRAHQEIVDLEAEFGADQILDDGGSALSSQAVGPKIRWVRDHEPDVFAAATQFYSLNSWIAAKLTGEYTLDHHTASQFDPLYEMPGRGGEPGQWNTKRCTAVCEHLELPRLVNPTDVVGIITEDAAAQTGLPVGTPVCAGTVDAWAEAFSAGVRKPGDVMFMYGSTFFVVQYVRELQARSGVWGTLGVEPGSTTAAAGMATSGLLIDWVMDLVGRPEFDVIGAEAEQLPPGADGLLMLPYFAGERSPVFDPMARGLAVGLTLDHTRAHLIRAACEGIAFGLRQILADFDGAHERINRVVSVGGGTQSRLWMQVVSDITSQVQEIPRQTVGASYGDALMAAIGTGAVPPETDWFELEERIEPDPARRSAYDQLFELYEQLYPQNKDVMHALSRLTSDDAGSGDDSADDVGARN